MDSIQPHANRENPQAPLEQKSRASSSHLWHQSVADAARQQQSIADAAIRQQAAIDAFRKGSITDSMGAMLGKNSVAIGLENQPILESTAPINNLTAPIYDYLDVISSYRDKLLYYSTPASLTSLSGDAVLDLPEADLDLLEADSDVPDDWIPSSARTEPEVLESMKPWQREVLTLWSNGLSSSQIAKRVGKADRTVTNFLGEIRKIDSSLAPPRQTTRKTGKNR